MVDGITRADLPKPSTRPQLYELAKMYEIRHHSKTCWKVFLNYKNYYYALILRMCETLKDSFERKLDNYEQMKSLAYAYIRKCSVQKCVYHIFPGQWLNFPKNSFCK